MYFLKLLILKSKLYVNNWYHKISIFSNDLFILFCLNLLIIVHQVHILIKYVQYLDFPLLFLDFIKTINTW